MKVSALIEKLSKMPKSAQVRFIYDGEPRGLVQMVWNPRNASFIVLAEKGETIYSEDVRPKDAPIALENPYWHC